MANLRPPGVFACDAPDLRWAYSCDMVAGDVTITWTRKQTLNARFSEPWKEVLLATLACNTCLTQRARKIAVPNSAPVCPPHIGRGGEEGTRTAGLERGGCFFEGSRGALVFLPFAHSLVSACGLAALSLAGGIATVHEIQRRDVGRESKLGHETLQSGTLARLDDNARW
jgi:hypothetical protein